MWFSFVAAILLAQFGVIGNSTVLQTLFTVLGIVYSVSMSMIMSFSPSKVLNKTIRLKLRSSIKHTYNMLFLDFGISTLCLVVALIWNIGDLRYLTRYFTIDIILIGAVFMATSLIYESYNFRKIHKLHTDIEDAIINEDIRINK
jgi:hypothetical protein